MAATVTEIMPDNYRPLERKRLDHHVDAVIDFTGGVAGGTASVLVGQPLDTVKVKLQTFPTSYHGMTHCIKHTFATEGFRHGLYAGTVPNLAAQISENAVLFAAYGVCQKGVAHVVGRDVPSLSALHNATAGFCAAFFSTIALCPTELIKCRLQTMEDVRTSSTSNSQGVVTNKRIGPWTLTRQILRQEGPAGMFRGFVPTALREMPGYFFFFGGYEFTRHLLTPPGSTKDDLGPFQTFVCGATGGVCLWVAIFPADVIKSRAQIQVGGPKQSVVSMAADIIQKEGVLALYRGLLPTLIRTVPATGALFIAYENVKKTLSHLAHKFNHE